MGEGKIQKFQDLWSQYDSGDIKDKDPWIMNGDQDNCQNNIDTAPPPSSSGFFSINEDSNISNGSCSSSDTRDDASSSATFSLSCNSSGALYDLSDLMSQLPIKVKSIEDLEKKESPYRRKYKGSKSFEAGLDAYRSFNHPKPIISKKTSRGSHTSSFLSRRESFINGSCRPPQIPLKKSLGG